MNLKQRLLMQLDALMLAGLLSCGKSSAPGDTLNVPNQIISYDCSTLTWDPAVSSNTPQNELLYAIYTATDPTDLSTVQNAQTNGTLLQDFTADLTSLAYAFDGNDVNVVVKDSAGTEAVYQQIFDETDCCFLGDALVTLANGELKRMDKIQSGDQLLAYNSQHKLTVSEVSSVERHEVTRYLHVQTQSGEVKVTAEHPFHTGERSVTEVSYKAIGQFNVGDYLSIQKDGSILPSKILALSEKLERTIVYYLNLTAEIKTYFANGFAVLDA